MSWQKLNLNNYVTFFLVYKYYKPDGQILWEFVGIIACLFSVRCIRNRTQQFAKRLHDAMEGLGTKDDSLIRVCVSRSEIDMVQIKEHYKQMYDTDLGKDIDVSKECERTISFRQDNNPTKINEICRDFSSGRWMQH